MSENWTLIKNSELDKMWDEILNNKKLTDDTVNKKDKELNDIITERDMKIAELEAKI